MDKKDYLYALAISKYYNGMEYLARGIVHISPKGLKKRLNIAYGSEKGQKYDIIYPEGNEKKPILFYIHGGGFVSGKLTLRRPYCYCLAKEGFFVANVDYRLAPKTHFPNQFGDIFKAVEAVLDNAAKYNLDTSKIVVAGESAGAYFANYIGVMSKKKDLFERLNVYFKYKDVFDVKSTVLIDGIYDYEVLSKIKAANCSTYIKAFYNLTNKEYENIGNTKNELFSSCTYIDKNYPPSIVIRGKYDAFDEAGRRLLELFDERYVEYCEYCTKGLSGFHGVAVAPINKEGKKALQFTADNLKKYINR